jgi:hypothetical protein
MAPKSGYSLPTTVFAGITEAGGAGMYELSSPFIHHSIAD